MESRRVLESSLETSEERKQNIFYANSFCAKWFLVANKFYLKGKNLIFKFTKNLKKKLKNIIILNDFKMNFLTCNVAVYCQVVGYISSGQLIHKFKEQQLREHFWVIKKLFFIFEKLTLFFLSEFPFLFINQLYLQSLIWGFISKWWPMCMNHSVMKGELLKNITP